MANYNLVQCAICNTEIGLDQKALRHENKWYHLSCKPALSKPILATGSTSSEKTGIYRTTIVSEKIYGGLENKNHVVSQTTPPVMLLTTNPSEQIAKPDSTTELQKTPKIVSTKKTAAVKTDPVLVVLALAIFSLLTYAAYSIFSIYSIAAIVVAAAITLYQILSRTDPQKQYQYKTKSASFFSIAVLVMPFAFGTVMAFDGYVSYTSVTKAIFVWSLTLSFWQTMLFVPLAIRSVTRERRLLPPTTYPRISVIVPAYNEENVIRTTIESLLSTDYPDKEIIVVDDGSKDGTLAIAMQYKTRVKVIHKENGGKASALNQGLLYATGDIVTIVDADTIIGNSSLKHIAASMAQENVVAVAGNVKIRNKMNWLTWCQALEYLSGIQIMRRGLDYFGAITIVPGALGAFRKKKLEEAGTYHKETLVEDFDATMKVLRSGMIVNGSNAATAYTQAPQALGDFYKQRKRWYRGNLQVLRRHSDILFNPRFGYLHRLSYPLMALHMLVIPVASLMLWIFAAYQIIVGNYFFVAYTLGMFILMQYLLSAMAVRMDNDDKKMILYSVFFVIGYKQIIDFLQIKAVVEELLRQKAKWTSAKRVKQ